MYSNVDYIAERFMMMGKMARNMPPSWDGAKIAIPVCSPCGQHMIGKMLPGRGVYVNDDLKNFGITKTLPYVFERSPVQRAIDLFRSERASIVANDIVNAAWLWPKNIIPRLRSLSPFLLGAISTYDGIINARGGGNANDVSFTKNSITTVANTWSALTDAGGFPVAAVFTSTPGAVMDRASTGALSFGIPNTAGGNKCYILTFGYTCAQALNMLILSDLLVQVGGVAVAGAGATVSSVALTRYTGGSGVLMTWEVTTQLGGTPSNLTVSYTNQAGTAAQSTGAIALTTSAIVGRLMPISLGPYMQLASGDFGVRAVATATTSANMTAGVLALHLYFPLAFIPGIAANVYVERDSTIQIDGITELTNVSGVVGYLTVYVFAGGTSSGALTGFVRTCQG